MPKNVVYHGKNLRIFSQKYARFTFALWCKQVKTPRFISHSADDALKSISGLKIKSWIKDFSEIGDGLESQSLNKQIAYIQSLIRCLKLDASTIFNRRLRCYFFYRTVGSLQVILLCWFFFNYTFTELFTNSLTYYIK